jgi:hypothetical protein
MESNKVLRFPAKWAGLETFLRQNCDVAEIERRITKMYAEDGNKIAPI